jgi:uncharacterized membrane protein required for colicin V production
LKPFDILLLVYVALGALRGWGRGLLAMAAGLAGFLVSLVLARVFYAQLAAYVDHHWHLQQAVQGQLSRLVPAGTGILGVIPNTLHLTSAAVVAALAFLAILFVAESVLGIFAATVGRLPNHLPIVGPLNRLAGLGFGALESLAVAAAVLLLLEPLAHSGALGSVSNYVVQAPWATTLWHLGQHFAPLLEKLP